MRRFARLATSVAAMILSRTAGGDEVSGADRLRTLYTAEFRFTGDRLPIVPIAIGDGLRDVTVSADGGLRVLPDGEGGPEVRADSQWHVVLREGTPARLRYWTVVWRGGPADSAAAAEEAKAWKPRGHTARVFEQGTLFAVEGEVLDRRQLLVGVGPHKTPEDADKAAGALAAAAGKPGLPASGFHTELAELPRGTIEAVGARTGVSVRNEGEIWFAPATDAPIRVGDKSYFGRVYVAIDRNGTLAVVNAVPEDRLLAGLVPAEIFPQAPDEALRAQAIAARGELLAKIGTRHLADPYRICSTTHCQVYAGAGKEQPRTTAAVKATRGMVLFAANRKDLADTVYSANCGGHGENNESVWPDMKPDPLLRGYPDEAGRRAPGLGDGEAAVAAFLDRPRDAWCGRAKIGAQGRFRWNVTLSAEELARLLPGFGAIKGIEVLERGVSGRARAVRIDGESRSDTVRGELRIRKTFGNLRSSLFVVEMRGGAAVFRGAGFGHGVGLCQTGAIGMAEAGKTHVEILKHYYRSSTIRKLW